MFVLHLLSILLPALGAALPSLPPSPPSCQCYPPHIDKRMWVIGLIENILQHMIRCWENISMRIIRFIEALITLVTTKRWFPTVYCKEMLIETPRLSEAYSTIMTNQFSSPPKGYSDEVEEEEGGVGWLEAGNTNELTRSYTRRPDFFGLTWGGGGEGCIRRSRGGKYERWRGRKCESFTRS